MMSDVIYCFLSNVDGVRIILLRKPYIENILPFSRPLQLLVSKWNVVDDFCVRSPEMFTGFQNI